MVSDSSVATLLQDDSSEVMTHTM